MNNRVVRFALTPEGFDSAIAAVDEYQKWLREKSALLVERLAAMGATKASLDFSRAVYTGIKDATVSVEPISKGYVVKANGESVLFIEFGSGVTYGYGHPEASKHGMGPGTYPSDKGHWDDVKGWWLPKDKGGGHTYGNPPSAPMYNAVKTIEQELIRVVKEVFV